jgi:hypothetical protein
MILHGHRASLTSVLLHRLWAASERKNVGCAESEQQDKGLERERQDAQAAVEETRGVRQQTKVSQRKLNQVKVGLPVKHHVQGWE